MKNKKPTLILALAAGLFIASCSSENSDTAATGDATSMTNDTTPVNEAAGFKFTYTLANMPSPLLLLDEYSKANLTVDINLLNPTANLGKYNSTLKQAFNFGIYGIDLAYIVTNDRAPEILSYYNTTRKLAQNLNLGETFDQFVDRFQKNSENKDSLTRIIDEAYTATDNYLRSNERLEAASEILTGSWLESQYIAVNSLKDVQQTPENTVLFNRIWEQHFHLGNLIKALTEFKDNPELQKIAVELETLHIMYKEPKDASEVNKAHLEKLSVQIAKIRSGIIS